jgi:hypothetical protein
VRVCDETGEELLAVTFAHDEKGLRALCRTLLGLKVELVAIERPDGLLVEGMLDAGLRVLAMWNALGSTEIGFVGLSVVVLVSVPLPATGRRRRPRRVVLPGSVHGEQRLR